MEVNENNAFKDRLLIFLKHIKEGQTKFETRCEIGRGSISKMKNSFGVDKLVKIRDRNHDLNMDWLIYGEGEMLKGDNNKCAPSEMDLGMKEDYIKTQKALIENLNEKIKHFEKELSKFKPKKTEPVNRS